MLRFLCRLRIHKWACSMGGPIGIDTLRSCSRCGILQKYVGGKHLDDDWMEVSYEI